MTGHPNDDTLRHFAAGSLPSVDLFEVDDHLSVCDTCRTRVARLAGAVEAIEQLSDDVRERSMHLTEDDLQLFAENRLPAEQAFQVRHHLAECQVCRRHADQLSAWTRSPQPLRRVALACAAAAVLVIGVLSAWLLSRNAARQPATPEVLASLSPAARAQFDAAIRAGSAELPPIISDLAPPRETLMGRPDTAAAFEISGPAGTTVVEDAPVFSWQSLPGDGGYVVTVFDEQGKEVARSPTLKENRWIPASPLPRDRTYTWQVSAERDGRMRVAPAPPAPPARFRVLAADRSAELQRIAHDFPDAHAVLGILYMEAGVRASAVAQFEQVRPGDAYANVARRSQDRLGPSAPPAR